MKIYKCILLLLWFAIIAGSVCGLEAYCMKLSGDCTLQSYILFNQTFDNAQIENVSANISIVGTGATATNYCNVTCVLNKAYGNYTNSTNESLVQNITFCNVEVEIKNGTTHAYYINQTADANQCNITYAIKLNSTTTIGAEYRPKIIGTSPKTLLYWRVGIASAITIGGLAYLWNIRRSS